MVSRRRIKWLLRQQARRQLTPLQKQERNQHILLFLVIVVICTTATYALLTATGAM